jgi:hypothetical protein
MRQGMRAPISTAVAIAVGFLMLISLMLPGLEDLRNQILNWAVLLAAIALVLGLANLFQVHARKIRDRDKPLYSLVLILAMLTTFGITLWQGSQGELAIWIFNNLQVPVETSLMAVLAVTLTVAAAKFFRTRSDMMGIVFIVTFFIVLLSSGPLFGLELPYFTRVFGPYVNNFFSLGAVRGILIGVGLGTLATGIRILIGADRPYGG